MDEDILTWEIDRWGHLLVTKEDETGSSMLRLGPLAHVVASLADFLRIAEGARGTRQLPASVDTLPKGQDAKLGLAGTEGSAVAKPDAQNTPPFRKEGEQ